MPSAVRTCGSGVADRNKKDKEKEDISDDIVFEMELIKQVEINIDYILMLVEKYHDDNCQDKEIIESIRRIVDSNPQLRSKKQLIEDFIGRVNVEDSMNSTISEEWYQYVLEEEKKDLDALIVAEKMPEYETRKFIENCIWVIEPGIEICYNNSTDLAPHWI